MLFRSTPLSGVHTVHPVCAQPAPISWAEIREARNEVAVPTSPFIRACQEAGDEEDRLIRAALDRVWGWKDSANHTTGATITSRREWDK